ncbi:thiamine pyrophosphate-dependent enzyme [Rhodococcus aetherivorans]|uniref:thiamine pyrophosphate-dependent enzyme n=1 Tax=Rhodococcus aetherivorans TaxID=191292 RepID=UPI00367699A5
MVLVDIPKDVLQARTTFSWPAERQLPGYHVITQPHDKQLRAAADLIATAERPVLYVGGGVIKADASNELRELAEQTGIPVGDHPHGPRRVPDSHRLHYGMPCMHGTVAVAALQRSDLLIALGARFDDRVTGDPASFAPHARVIHVDIDPAEIGKHRFVDVPIVGDCKTTISSLIRHIRARPACPPAPDPTGWYADLDRLRDTFPLGNTRPPTGALAPERVIDAIGRTAGPDAIYVSGVGQHQMWAAHFITYDKPRTWLNSGGFGTMGYAVPAALGARLGTPDREVWAIDGDGCLQMTNQELATAAVEGIPVKVAIINNGNLGMVRQLQQIHYQGRYSSVNLATHSRRIPDLALLAEALGCVANTRRISRTPSRTRHRRPSRRRRPHRRRHRPGLADDRSGRQQRPPHARSGEPAVVRRIRSSGLVRGHTRVLIVSAGEIGTRNAAPMRRRPTENDEGEVAGDVSRQPPPRGRRTYTSSSAI